MNNIKLKKKGGSLASEHLMKEIQMGSTNCKVGGSLASEHLMKEFQNGCKIGGSLASEHVMNEFLTRSQVGSGKKLKNKKKKNPLLKGGTLVCQPKVITTNDFPGTGLLTFIPPVKTLFPHHYNNYNSTFSEALQESVDIPIINNGLSSSGSLIYPQPNIPNHSYNYPIIGGNRKRKNKIKNKKNK